MDVLDTVLRTIVERDLAKPDTPVVLMVSGGSDSTALAYLAHELSLQGSIGPLGIMHVNHQLRGVDAAADASFVKTLAEALELPFFLYERDIAGKAAEDGDNIEAVARHERYQAAHDALAKLCRRCHTPVAEGRIFTAHNQDDRVENFYMRSIVGTGPGGFRSMLYLNGQVARPCLDVDRAALRDYLQRRQLDAKADSRVVLITDDNGRLWREDATNAHTDRFRAFVRHNLVPLAQQRNPRHAQTLCRSMNLIADEDDMLETMARQLLDQTAQWQTPEAGGPAHACLLAPAFCQAPVPLQRRAAAQVLKALLDEDARVETASIEAIVGAFCDGVPISGYTANIQGDLALSANKKGLRIEPMAAYRARRKGVR